MKHLEECARTAVRLIKLDIEKIIGAKAGLSMSPMTDFVKE
jgi:hypothetical protein